MVSAFGYKPADWGFSPSEISSRNSQSFLREVELQWQKPVPLVKGQKAIPETSNACLYIVFRSHWKSLQSIKLKYVGITESPSTRFRKHEKVDVLKNLRGGTFISYAEIGASFPRAKRESIRNTLEQIEHLLIWCLWSDLENERKTMTLPGMGQNGASAWRIVNKGYRFAGLMPQEIVFPWALVKPGRDRSMCGTK